MLDFDLIVAADRGLRPQIVETPLERSTGLSSLLDCEVWLKNEHLLPTGSFKVRGSANKIRVLDSTARGLGVITASTGNHGQGVARAASLAKTAAMVFIPDSAPVEKQEAMRNLGAELVLVEGNALDAELAARAQAEKDGKPYIPPYNDLDVIAGQATVGMELARQAPDLDAVFVCVGGGGLVGGVGTALKQLSPSTCIVGVSPAASTCMLDSLEAGKIVRTPEAPTLSEASTGAVEAGSVTFPICRDVIDRTVRVGEDAIARAMRDIAKFDRWIVEGAAGAALAGLVETAGDYRGKKVAIVLCGRNIALDLWMKAMRMAGSS